MFNRRNRVILTRSGGLARLKIIRKQYANAIWYTLALFIQKVFLRCVTGPGVRTPNRGIASIRKLDLPDEQKVTRESTHEQTLSYGTRDEHS